MQTFVILSTLLLTGCRSARQQILTNAVAGEKRAYETMVTSLLSRTVTGDTYHDSQGVGYLLNKQSLQRSLHRYKALVNVDVLPSVPNDLINIPEKYRSLSTGELFLQYVGPCGTGSEGICLIFYTDESISALFNARIIFGDGTFSVVPRFYKTHFKNSQLLVLAYQTYKKLQVGAYALIPGKSIVCYEFVFRNMMTHAKQLLSWDPEHSRNGMFDFEKGLRNAARKELELENVTGCFFHFCQCIYRKIASLPSLKLRYLQKSSVTHEFVKALCALAFINADTVKSTYYLLIDFFKLKCPDVFALPDMKVFLNYFAQNWVINVDAIQSWNVSSSVDNIRTNNSLEGENHALQLDLGVRCYNFFTFLERLGSRHVSFMILTN